MAVYEFGSGALFGVRTDGTGPYTPLQFGILQDVSMDLSFNLKELMGTYQFPVAVARGAAKITCKAKVARMLSRQWNDIFFGQTLATGQLLTAFDESGTVPGTPYQVTVTNSATWTTDLGVYASVTGIPLVKVSSGPTTGQYSVAAGVYTFAAADTTLVMKISYTYTSTTAGTGKISVANSLLGAGPIFQANFYQTYNSKNLNIQLNQCVSSKLSIATKLEDWNIPEFDFSCFADSSANIMTLSITE